ncbi:NAD(P)H-dependent oxidoreductase [Streptomyces sp. CA-278952]|uniref:NADPH-dependent FMN reductase n=1 Tax=Streptomyces sp. CA-278952 TaxID=2980556 RepID=UPI0023684EB2|nr:NAD(P)H-dependent oxidoreductase [Streptomyces sp. CA-278952]WDG30194.1 NAD(P)H-dependent oxidoreductase [Streptomyces sp. CA-278952]
MTTDGTTGGNAHERPGGSTDESPGGSRDAGSGLPLRVAVIIGSTREGRIGDAVGRWFMERAQDRSELDLAVLDLAAYDFPVHYPGRATEQMTEFTEEIARAEAFVVVTPEYNRSFPASLKQAIDFAYEEWQTKPVAFVSYGHGSAGLYAVEQLRSVFTELHTVTLRNGVALDFLRQPLEGHPGDTGRDRSVGLMLDQLGWWGRALREARAARPYVS